MNINKSTSQTFIRQSVIYDGGVFAFSKNIQNLCKKNFTPLLSNFLEKMDKIRDFKLGAGASSIFSKVQKKTLLCNFARESAFLRNFWAGERWVLVNQFGVADVQAFYDDRKEDPLMVEERNNRNRNCNFVGKSLALKLPTPQQGIAESLMQNQKHKERILSSGNDDDATGNLNDSSKKNQPAILSRVLGDRAKQNARESLQETLGGNRLFRESVFNSNNNSNSANPNTTRTSEQAELARALLDDDQVDDAAQVDRNSIFVEKSISRRKAALKRREALIFKNSKKKQTRLSARYAREFLAFLNDERYTTSCMDEYAEYSDNTYSSNNAAIIGDLAPALLTLAQDVRSGCRNMNDRTTLYALQICEDLNLPEIVSETLSQLHIFCESEISEFAPMSDYIFNAGRNALNFANDSANSTRASFLQKEHRELLLCCLDCILAFEYFIQALFLKNENDQRGSDKNRFDALISGEKFHLLHFRNEGENAVHKKAGALPSSLFNHQFFLSYYEHANGFDAILFFLKSADFARARCVEIAMSMFSTIEQIGNDAIFLKASDKINSKSSILKALIFVLADRQKQFQNDDLIIRFFDRDEVLAQYFTELNNSDVVAVEKSLRFKSKIQTMGMILGGDAYSNMMHYQKAKAFSDLFSARLMQFEICLSFAEGVIDFTSGPDNKDITRSVKSIATQNKNIAHQVLFWLDEIAKASETDNHMKNCSNVLAIKDQEKIERLNLHRELFGDRYIPPELVNCGFGQNSKNSNNPNTIVSNDASGLLGNVSIFGKKLIRILIELNEEKPATSSFPNSQGFNMHSASLISEKIARETELELDAIAFDLTQGIDQAEESALEFFKFYADDIGTEKVAASSDSNQKAAEPRSTQATKTENNEQTPPLPKISWAPDKICLPDCLFYASPNQISKRNKKNLIRLGMLKRHVTLTVDFEELLKSNSMLAPIFSFVANSRNNTNFGKPKKQGISSPPLFFSALPIPVDCLLLCVRYTAFVLEKLGSARRDLAKKRLREQRIFMPEDNDKIASNASDEKLFCTIRTAELRKSVIRLLNSFFQIFGSLFLECAVLANDALCEANILKKEDYSIRKTDNLETNGDKAQTQMLKSLRGEITGKSQKELKPSDRQRKTALRRASLSAAAGLLKENECNRKETTARASTNNVQSENNHSFSETHIPIVTRREIEQQGKFEEHFVRIFSQTAGALEYVKLFASLLETFEKYCCSFAIDKNSEDSHHIGFTVKTDCMPACAALFNDGNSRPVPRIISAIFDGNNTAAHVGGLSRYFILLQNMGSLIRDGRSAVANTNATSGFADAMNTRNSRNGTLIARGKFETITTVDTFNAPGPSGRDEMAKDCAHSYLVLLRESGWFKFANFYSTLEKYHQDNPFIGWVCFEIFMIIFLLFGIHSSFNDMDSIDISGIDIQKEAELRWENEVLVSRRRLDGFLKR